MSADKWIWGCVNSDGSILSGSGFNARRVDTPDHRGRYEITYERAFKKTPAVMVMQLWGGESQKWNNFNFIEGSSVDNSVLVASSETKFKVKIGNDKGRGEDRNFTFIAIGPA
jgi:hypothetical protein